MSHLGSRCCGRILSRISFTVFGATLALALHGRPLAAQLVQELRVVRSFPDSSVWRPFMEYTVRLLGHQIASAAADTVTRPWRMTFPSSAPPWPTVERELRDALNARRVTAEDSAYDGFGIGALTLAGNTARVDVTISRTRRCPGTNRTTGWSSRFNLFSVRAEGDTIREWSAARQSVVRVGDSLGC